MLVPHAYLRIRLLVHDALERRRARVRFKNTIRLTCNPRCGTHEDFQSSLSNPLLAHGPITRSCARAHSKETVCLTGRDASDTQKQLQGLLTNAQDLIDVRWGSVIILRIPSCPHLYNKTHPGFSLNTETVLAARVKVHKARRVIHTNAGNSCFCYSSHQFNEHGATK